MSTLPPPSAERRTKRTRDGKGAPSGPSSARRQGHLIGYARVSTTGQDTATQEAKLKAAGCTLIRTEIVSGGSRNGRNELASILDFIRRGDALIVVKLDHLGRSTRDVRSQSRARIGRKGSKPAGSGARHRHRWADGPHGPDCVGHGRRGGAWLYP